MNSFNQHSAIVSLEKSLIAAPDLVDARTERDWLFFLGEFASMINFYDNNNVVNGNWTPFLLKDPVFLLATISKTKISELHSSYFNTKNNVAHFLTDKGNVQQLATGINELFDQLFDLLKYIKRWLYFMITSVEEYELKKFVVSQIKHTYGKYFWAIISLRQNLFLSSVIPGVEAIDPLKLNNFETQEEAVWQQHRNKTPYYETLNLKHPLKENTSLDIFKAIEYAGDQVFVFFNAVVNHANTAFENLKLTKSIHPDTTLLRSFIHLLKIQQAELNGLAQKHQHFYYHDILKQSPRLATPDYVFAFADLIKKDATYLLPSRTLLDAGINTEKRPVLFETAENVLLNPAYIINAYLFNKMTSSTGRYAYFLEKITEPGIPKKTESGKVLQLNSPTFDQKQIKLQQIAIAFASPMLLLREGNRKIVFSFEYIGMLDNETLKEVSFYLTTVTGWIKVAATHVEVATALTGSINKLAIKFELSPLEPAIEVILGTATNGFETEWPMFKIEFHSFTSAVAVPTILSLAIETEVSGITATQVYNDNGALDVKPPFPLFGNAPILNSNFILGSTEVFSKPLYQFGIEIDWDKVPANFSDYYQQYNQHLRTVWDAQYSPPKKTWIGRFFRWFIGLFKKNSDYLEDQFHNDSFKVDFQMLHQKKWNPIKMVSKRAQTHIPTSISLYDEDENFDIINNSTFITHEELTQKFTTDSAIQLKPLKYTNESECGFFRLQLSEPLYGFGAELYPAIVYEQALQNAWLLYKKKKMVNPPANLPFVPLATAVTLNYVAKQEYNFSKRSKNAYPISCFYFTPFKNYKVYDHLVGILDYEIKEKDFASPNLDGLLIFLSTPFKSMLFLEVEDLLPTASLNIYFELQRKFKANNITSKAAYFYGTPTGWEPLVIAADGTNNLNSTGIVQVKIPDEIGTDSATMPNGKFWIAIGFAEEPQNFPSVFLIRANGFSAKRSGDFFLTDQQEQLLPANSILGTKEKTPIIKKIVQPFSSFGGRPAENPAVMDGRISKRIKTKDRIRGKEDHYLLIAGEFKSIFYAKSIFDRLLKTTKIYLVNRTKNLSSTNSFLPLVNDELEREVEAFLKARASAFSNIEIAHFEFQHLKVTAAIIIKPGFEKQQLEQTINSRLNIYLSPWIESEFPQIKIEEKITDTQVLNFIKSIEGVVKVEELTFQTVITQLPQEADFKNLNQLNAVVPINQTNLIVPFLKHNINCEYHG